VTVSRRRWKHEQRFVVDIYFWVLSEIQLTDKQAVWLRSIEWDNQLFTKIEGMRVASILAQVYSARNVFSDEDQEFIVQAHDTSPDAIRARDAKWLMARSRQIGAGFTRISNPYSGLERPEAAPERPKPADYMKLLERIMAAEGELARAYRSRAAHSHALNHSASGCGHIRPSAEAAPSGAKPL